ncbi:MAG: CehA/McbA family metallohydrolase, partial [bacterium]
VGMVKASPGSTGTHSYYLIVGDGDIASVFKEKYRLEGRENTGMIEGRCVTKGTGEPATDAEIYLLSPVGNYRYQAMVRPDGSFRFVSQPEEYVVQAVSFDRNDSEPASVKVETGKTKEVLVEIEPPAKLEYEIADDNGDLIPALISFKKIEGKPTLLEDKKFSMGKYGGGFYKNHFAKDSSGTVEIRPGKYEVYFSRGVEYEYVMKTLDLKSGESLVEKIVLKHVVDTTGYLSGDFHVHSRPSPDSDDTVYDKVLGSAALGLEVPVATDHDRYNDYKPYIKKLGLGRYVNSIVGDELTTIRLGHFNGYPMTQDFSKRNEGAIDWYGMTGPEIFQAFRDDPGELEVVQLNHPRTLGGGYLDFVGYNSDEGAARDKVNFSWNFDAIEVLNGRGYGDLKRTVPDWYSFLNRGKRVAGVGNSDCHDVYKLGLGYPRNFVVSPTDVAGDMDEDEFVQAVLDQKVSVSGGPFIRFNINGEAGLGEVITDTDGAVDLNIDVQAPSWVKVETLTIVGNGEELKTINLTNENVPLRFNGTVTMNPERDTWYVVRVEGTEKLFPVYPDARPYSFTNPIYVDVDGNGRFDPPMKFGE